MDKEGKSKESKEGKSKEDKGRYDKVYNEDKNAKGIDEKHQKASCGFKSIAGIERWGVKTGGREWAEND